MTEERRGLTGYDPLAIAGFPRLRVRYAGADRPAFVPLWLSNPVHSQRAAKDWRWQPCLGEVARGLSECQHI